MQLNCFANTISIVGNKVPGKYKVPFVIPYCSSFASAFISLTLPSYTQVTLKTTIIDVHGQSLPTETVLKYRATPPTAPSLSLTHANYVLFGSGAVNASSITLDPFVPPVLCVSTKNTRELRVRAYAVNHMYTPSYVLLFQFITDYFFQYVDIITTSLKSSCPPKGILLSLAIKCGNTRLKWRYELLPFPPISSIY
jgi:hypothetical protein